MCLFIAASIYFLCFFVRICRAPSVFMPVPTFQRTRHHPAAAPPLAIFPPPTPREKPTTGGDGDGGNSADDGKDNGRQPCLSTALTWKPVPLFTRKRRCSSEWQRFRMRRPSSRVGGRGLPVVCCVCVLGPRERAEDVCLGCVKLPCRFFLLWIVPCTHDRYTRTHVHLSSTALLPVSL